MAGSLKNPGTKLFFSQFGGEQPIPPEFIAAMERSEETQSVPNDIGPEALSDTIVESKVETNRTDERVRKTVKKKKGNIVLRSINTDNQGFPVQITRTLFPTGTTPAVPTATDKVAVQDLGNGWSIQEVAVEGSYDNAGNFVPGIFDRKSFERERPDITPEEFRVAAQTVTTEQDVVGQAADPTLIANDLARSEVQQSSFVKRIMRKFRDAVLGTALTHYETDPEKEIVTVVRTLLANGPPTIPPSATVDVVTQNLGDGRMVQTTATKPEVFPQNVFGKDRPDIVPEEFKVAIPAETVEITEAGVAAARDLVAGELSHQETQVKKFVRRVRSVLRAAATLGTSLISYRTDQDRQLETVTRTYKVSGTPTAPTAKKKVTVTNLGDGRVVEEVAEVPEVFPKKVFRAQRPNAIPELYQSYDPPSTTSIDEPGVAAAPTLNPTEIQKTSSQVDEFTKRTEVVTQNDPTVFQSVDRTATTTEFGATITASSDTFGLGGSMIPEKGKLVAESEVKTLRKAKGTDPGLDVLRTRKIYGSNPADLSEFDTLHGIDVDLETLTVKPYTEQVIGPADAATSVNVQPTYVDVATVAPIDPFRSKQTIRRIPTEDLVTNYRRVFPGRTNVDLPLELTAVQAYVESNAGGAIYSASGTVSGTGVGAHASANLSGQAEASAAAIAELDYDVKGEGWGSNVPCIHALFVVRDNSSEAIVFTRLNSILGSVFPWPKWNQKRHTIVCTGQQKRLTTRGNIQAEEGVTVDFHGEEVGRQKGSGSGSGDSLDIGVSIKLSKIPATVHRAITIGLPGSLSASATATLFLSIPGVTPVSIAGLSVSAAATISPTTLPSTGYNEPGNLYDFIPLSGLFLHELRSEPMEGGLIKMHAVIVDMSRVAT